MFKKIFVGFLFLVYQGNAQDIPVVKTKPNIIVILMDDMGYGDPECYNGMEYHTPQINRLAEEGMRFTNFYAAQSICSASRAGLLTGCYPNRVGISGALFPWAPIALNPKEETIASVLKKNGYYTAMTGKWHLGAKAPYLPLSYGFDEYLGLPYSNDMWPVDYDGTPKANSKFSPLPLIEGDKPVQFIQTLDDQAQLTSIYTKRAVKIIKENSHRPFFLYLAHSMPHAPIAVSKAFKGKSKEGLYGDMMMEVDWSIGEIMKALKEEGIEKNTLIVFTSDNGPWIRFGNQGGNTGGLREGKGTVWEGGQREPCIIRWPDMVPAGTVCSQLASTIDLLPTICSITGSSLPKERIDGVNILPLLKNEIDANPRNDMVYYYRKNALGAVRQGRWKLVFPHEYGSIKDSVVRDGFPKPAQTLMTSLALYDLRTDPGEVRDVKDFYPHVMKELNALADKYRQTLGDDLTQQPCKECREAAKVK